MNITCRITAPFSQDFSADVYEEWGAAGIIYLAIPVLFSCLSLAIYIENVIYILRKSNSKDLRNSLLWLLGIHPAIICIATIGVFIPRSLIYLTFMFNIYFAYANYKYYYLIMVFAGGSKAFVEKSSAIPIKTNLVPCCCLFCLPKIYNSVKTVDVAKWLIFQNVICTPFYGALTVVLKSDNKLYSLSGPSSSFYLSLFNSLSSLFSIYGFKMISVFTKQIQGMEQTHKVKGKTLCMQLTMIVIGFEGIIFNAIGSFGAFPCKAPFAFNTRSKAFNNYAVILQCFLLILPMRKFYRRSQDIQQQHILTDEVDLERNNEFYNVRAVNPQETQNNVESKSVSTDLNQRNNYGSNGEFLNITDDISGNGNSSSI